MPSVPSHIWHALGIFWQMCSSVTQFIYSTKHWKWTWMCRYWVLCLLLLHSPLALLLPLFFSSKGSHKEHLKALIEHFLTRLNGFTWKYFPVYLVQLMTALLSLSNCNLVRTTELDCIWQCWNADHKSLCLQQQYSLTQKSLHNCFAFENLLLNICMLLKLALSGHHTDCSAFGWVLLCHTDLDDWS